MGVTSYRFQGAWVSATCSLHPADRPFGFRALRLRALFGSCFLVLGAFGQV
jgi:hypothetical protein